MIPLVEQLAETWSSLDAVCAELTEEEWKRPTGCPGWSVQDNVSHLIDYEASALGLPRPEHEPGEVSHARNDLGRRNEVGVDVRRGRPGAEVLAELREVTAARLAPLGGITEVDLSREVDTPIGKGSLQDLLTMRVMDTWSHEQDIRRALARPGHLDGPAATTAVVYFSQFLPFVVGKSAAAPEGATVVFHVGVHAPVAVEVVDGRGRPAASLPEQPSVGLAMDVSTFAALVCGRSDARPEAVKLSGDLALGRRIVATLGFMP